jgi:RNA polymerase sigma factor (sigma-70 family)
MMDEAAQLERYTGMLRNIANRRYHHLPHEDKMQAMVEGALRGIREADPSRGSVASFVYRCAYTELNRLMCEVGYPVVIPHHIDLALRHGFREARRTGEDLNMEKAAARAKVTPVTIKTALHTLNKRTHCRITDEGGPLPCTDVNYEHVSTRVDIMRAIQRALTPHQRKYVLAYYFGPAGTTIRDVAEQYNVSWQSVHRLLQKAAASLRVALEAA